MRYKVGDKIFGITENEFCVKEIVISEARTSEEIDKYGYAQNGFSACDLEEKNINYYFGTEIVDKEAPYSLAKEYIIIDDYAFSTREEALAVYNDLVARRIKAYKEQIKDTNDLLGFALTYILSGEPTDIEYETLQAFTERAKELGFEPTKIENIRYSTNRSKLYIVNRKD